MERQLDFSPIAKKVLTAKASYSLSLIILALVVLKSSKVEFKFAANSRLASLRFAELHLVACGRNFIFPSKFAKIKIPLAGSVCQGSGNEIAREALYSVN